MDIANQLKQIGVFLTGYGFVTILEKVARTPVLEVEDNSVAGKQAAHEDRKVCHTRAKEQMKMVGHKRPGKAFGVGFYKKFGETFKEQAAVIIVDKNIPPLDSANDNVLQQTGNVYACCTWHERKIAEEVKLVN